MGNRVVARCFCCLKPPSEGKKVREASVASDHTYQEVSSPVKVETSSLDVEKICEKVVPDSKWDLKVVKSSLSAAVEALVTIAEATDELPMLVNKPDVKVYGKESAHGFLIKTCWEMQCTQEDFLEFARDKEARLEWDANIDQCRLIAPITSDIDANYERYKKVTLVSQRDVLVASTLLRCAEAWVTVSTSIESPLVPPNAGILRANMRIGGYYVRKAPTGCTVTSVSELNFGGSLPNSLLVRMSAMAMPAYVKSLTTALAKRTAAKFTEKNANL